MDADAALRRWCYGGEELLAAEAVERGAVGVTSHRVLALTPDGAGPRFRAVDRPNVTDIGVRSSGPTDHRARGAQAGVAALALLVAGAVIDLGGLVTPVEPPTGVGVGGLIALVNALLGALALVDEALTLLGLVALVVALASLGWYRSQRERVLEVGVAGGDPVRVPVGRNERTAADRLVQALGDDESRQASSDAGPGVAGLRGAAR